MEETAFLVEEMAFLVEEKESWLQVGTASEALLGFAFRMLQDKESEAESFLEVAAYSVGEIPEESFHV